MERAMTPTPPKNGVEPRPYQKRIVEKVVGHLGAGDRSVLIESPTGSGKTVMGLLIARAIQQRHGFKVGWVANRRYLLAQAAAENEARGIGVNDLRLISMFDREPPADVDFLIVDECQHDAADSMAHIHNVVKPKMILGLTATPFRSDRVKLCFQKVIKDAGIHQLIQDGYLSQYHHYTMPCWAPRDVAEFYAREPQKWGKSLLFFHTLAQCAVARDALARHGIASDIVTGSSDREAQLDAFASGRINLLINCMVLTEGFDAPNLKTVFVRPSCKGATIQMGGRVFRKHPDHPVKQVVQCKSTPWPLTRTAQPLEQYLWMGDGWGSVKVNPHLNAINARARLLIARTEVTLPRVVLAAQSKRRFRPERSSL
jgi:superfamily II DNA or RNA helicase